MAVCFKLIYSEKATKFCENSNLLLSGKSRVEISQNFVAFSEYNFTREGVVQKCRLFVNIHRVEILNGKG